MLLHKSLSGCGLPPRGSMAHTHKPAVCSPALARQSQQHSRRRVAGIPLLPTFVARAQPDTEPQQHSQAQEQQPASSSSSNGSSNGSSPQPEGTPPYQPPASAASTESTSTASGSPTTTPPRTPPKPSINSTLSMLDAVGIVGVEEKERKKKEEEERKKEAEKQAAAASTTDTSVSPEAMQKIADADRERFGGQPGRGDEVDAQFARIVDKAKKLADNQASEAEQAQLKREFDGLLQKISKGPEAMSKEDIQRLKDAAFGPQTFWVTETQPIADLERTGLLIRGNLRDERTKVYEFVCQKVQELFGEKFTVLMVEDTLATEEDIVNGRLDMSGDSPASRNAALNNPRVAFNIVPTAQVTPPQTTGWGNALAVVLAILIALSCGQLALAANVTKLPKETLEWFANPSNLESDALPPGLDTWDPSSYFASALPIFAAVLGINLSHEIGHRLQAFENKVKLGPTYFIPNFQIGSFGGITPFTQLLKDRRTLWDVSSGGPLAGAAISALLLGAGLLQSQGVTDASAATDMMVPVPTTLFQGSLLLGSITRAVLGDQALRGTTVLVSPLVIAGWCGMVTQALQLLPVGNVDGGRMVQAAYGRQALSLSSFFTYVGLGLGLLGSSLALPYGLYVIICQRNAEQYIKDTVTPPGEPRATVTAVAVLAAILILLPMAPELADAFGIGPADRFLF